MADESTINSEPVEKEEKVTKKEYDGVELVESIRNKNHAVPDDAEVIKFDEVPRKPLRWFFEFLSSLDRGIEIYVLNKITDDLDLSIGKNFPESKKSGKYTVYTK